MQALQRPPAVSSSLRGLLRCGCSGALDLVSTCRGGSLKGLYSELTRPGEGEPWWASVPVTRTGDGSGRPPGAVPVDEGDPEFAAVLGGDDELELGDPERGAVVLGLQELPGRQGHRGHDEDVVAGRLCHGRSSL